MRSSERAHLLERFAPAMLEEALAWRRTTPSLDTASQDLLEALAGQGLFDQTTFPTVLSRIEARTDERDRPWLTRVMAALSWAGGKSWAHGILERARAALARLDDAERRKAAAGLPFFGRDEELAALRGWLSAPLEQPPVRTLFVTGLPAIGKSTLLERVVDELAQAGRRVVVIRLDFDRPSLDVLDRVGLTLEVARQIGTQLPEDAAQIRQLRVEATSTVRDRSSKGEKSNVLPQGLLSRLSDIVATTRCRVIVVLDTFEMVRGRGATHPRELFAWLDELVSGGLRPMSVIAAGRGDAFDSIPERVTERRNLNALSEHASNQVLDRLGVPTAAHPAVRGLAQGNPLLLRIAATTVKSVGIRGLSDASGPDDKPEVVTAHLYRFLRSRILSPELQTLAHPGLVVRWISPALIREVLAPAVGLRLSGEGQAELLFKELEQHHWLLEPQPGADWLRQRADMRAVLLPLLYAEDPEGCAKIDRAAAAWFERRPEPWLRAQGSYHRLQATRAGDPMPSVAPDVAVLFDNGMLAELPEAARDAVLQARGLRSSVARKAGASRTSRAVDPRAVTDLRMMLEKGDWVEAEHIYEHAFRPQRLDAISDAADAARSFLWRVGRWSEATELLEHKDRAQPGDEDYERLQPFDALVRLEMRAELEFAGLADRLAHNEELRSSVVAFLARGSGSDLTTGALGFCLAAVRGHARPQDFRSKLDPVGAALALWADGYGSRSALEQAFIAAVARYEQQGLIAPTMPPIGVGEQPEDQALLARALSALSPYGAPIQLLARASRRHRLEEHASAVLKALSGRPGELLQTRGLRWTESASSPLSRTTVLQDLGLLAEWAGVAARFLRDRDLSRIAAAAERWRRTVAGLWSYPCSPPAGWFGFRTYRTLDVATWRQVQSLLSETGNAVRDGLTLLELWRGDVDEAAYDRALAPVRATLQSMSLRGTDPSATAMHATRRLIGRFPAALAAPSAVIAVSERYSSELGSRNPVRRAGIPDHHRTSAQEIPMRAPAPVPSPSQSPLIRGYEESRGRLEGPLNSRGMRDAAAKAIEAGRIDLKRFGMNSQQALAALSARPNALESVGVTPPALEALIRRTGRPPLVVRNDAVVLEPLPDFPGDIDVKIRGAEAYLPSIGRVEFVNHSMAWGGTGWVVDRKGNDYTVATNRHVAKIVARRAKDGTGVFLRSSMSGVRYGAMVDFNEELGARPEEARAVPVTEITYLADDFSADIALLKVRKASGADWTMPDPIILADREAARDELVAIVGYPAYDDRHDGSDAAVKALANYFRDLYDVKRFAPGRLLRAQSEGVISHDCTSLGGNSGSPVLSLEQNGVVGLHFAGLYGVENSAVGVSTLKSLLRGEIIAISRRLADEGTGEAADGVHEPEDLADRGGYDPSFLGKKFAVPWPELPKELEKDLAEPSDVTTDRPHELRYTHFGVKFSKTYKLPLITAVNIDGLKSMRIKRGADQWFYDLRIPKNLQHGSKSYRDRLIDRGHMIRREDPNWGRDAKQADSDTFHYTNAAPQHSELNQGKTLWQGLENYLLDSARTHGFKACVFTGPVFGEDDPELDEGIRIPLEFWKVAVMVDANRKALHATAYLLSQGQMIRKLMEDRARSEALEGFVLSEYRTFQIALADLEAATGYNFKDLKSADPLARTKTGEEALRTKQPLVFELTSPSDLVL
jgi:endonuclease G